MRKTLLALSLACAAFAAASAAQSGRRPVAPPAPPAVVEPTPSAPPAREAPAPRATYDRLPEVLMNRELQSIEKGSFHLSDFGGKVLVINLWASWCGPCRREIPDYENVRKEYAGREVEFIGLTTEDPGEASEKVNQFVRQTRFGF